MYKPGDKFIIELKERFVNSDNSFDEAGVWRIKGLKGFFIDEESLRELGKFNEKVWLETLDDVRNKVTELKKDYEKLMEKNRLLKELVERKEKEGCLNQ